MHDGNEASSLSITCSVCGELEHMEYQIVQYREKFVLSQVQYWTETVDSLLIELTCSLSIW